MNRRKFLTYNSIFLTGLPSYIKNKYFEYNNNINQEHSVWNINYKHNPYKLQKININKKSELQIHTINVGQADSTLISTPNNKKILIDVGHYYHEGKYIHNYLNKYNIRKLDAVILTHPHWDHIGGFKKIMDTYTIDKIIYNGQKHNTNTYKKFKNTLEEYDTKINIVKENNTIDLDSNLDIKVINPTKNYNKNKKQHTKINNNSIVIHLSYNNSSILLPADIEKETEKRLIKKYGSKLQSDIYKVAHHGDKESTTKEFLKNINPDISIISSSYYSEFNYPHKETLKRLYNKNIDTYWTGVHGSTVAVTKGEKWNIYNQSNKKPNNIKQKSQINYFPSSGLRL